MPNILQPEGVSEQVRPLFLLVESSAKKLFKRELWIFLTFSNMANPGTQRQENLHVMSIKFE